MNKKYILALALVLAVAFAVPVFAGPTPSGDTTNYNFTSHSDAESEARSEARSESESRATSIQGQLQGQAQGQGQGQLAVGKVDTTVGGDTEKINTYVMTAPNTVAGQGQQASSVYSIFGGVNMAQTAEYQICREKIDVVKNMEVAGYITKEQAQAEALEAFAQLKDATQVKRILWVGPKTRGVHLGNAFGMLSMDSCNEINWDNAMGLKKKSK